MNGEDDHSRYIILMIISRLAFNNIRGSLVLLACISREKHLGDGVGRLKLGCSGWTRKGASSLKKMATAASDVPIHKPANDMQQFVTV